MGGGCKQLAHLRLGFPVEALADQLAGARIPLWQLAEALGVSEPTMTRKLRHELPEDEKARIMALIYKLAKAS
jgi:hypothetical protein